METTRKTIPIGTRVRITTGMKTYGLTGEIAGHFAPKYGTATQRLNLLAHRVVLDKGGVGDYDPRELEVIEEADPLSRRGRSWAL